LIAHEGVKNSPRIHRLEVHGLLDHAIPHMASNAIFDDNLATS
jgi:hypothetical protein